MKNHILIIGSGIAALQCARLLPSHKTIHLITKREIYESSSYYAQGGIATVWHHEDSFSSHEQDTHEAGVNHTNHEMVQLLVREGHIATKELIQAGLPVDRTSDGEVSLGLEGAHSHHRIIHSGGDATGKNTIEFLYKTLPSNVIVHEQECAIQLIKNPEQRVIGVYTKNVEGALCRYTGEAVILATGGIGSLYPQTSNCENSFGDGIALAYLAGATVADLEFIQFHPTLLFQEGKTHGLVSEAVRGAGARFVNEQQHYFMEDYPQHDLAPRHITAKAVYDQIKQGHTVFLDISCVENFTTQFPSIAKKCSDLSISLETQRIPITVGSHFLMGGIMTNVNSETSLPGLYAIGEVACNGIHGANRLASNSLLEGLAFGKRLAKHLHTSCEIDYTENVITTQKKQLPSLMTPSVLQQHMMHAVGIIRNEHDLDQLSTQLQQPLLQDVRHLTQLDIEHYFMHVTAQLIVQAALARKESRGGHIRSDYPQSDNSLTQTLFIQQKDQPIYRGTWYEFTQTQTTTYGIFQ